METDTGKLHARLSLLNGALDDLETELEPLFAQTLPEIVVDLETIQQAKLQVALPYLVYDLVFIYLRTRGIDPKTHPVIGELDRVRQYFDKLKNAEDPPKRTVAVDKGAANRFIKHAIAQVNTQRPPGDQEGPTHIRFNEDGDIRVPVKVTSKMLAREQYQKELKEVGSEEEEELEVIDVTRDAADDDIMNGNGKGKGKAKAVVDEDINDTSARKRRRPPIDPFAGYGDEPAQASKSAESLKRGKPTTEDIIMADGPNPGGDNHPISLKSAPEASTKKDKKAAKKAKKAKRRDTTN
ncbi:hypothetical protein BKA93DRAFT_252896 [Sparassis latifolia]